MNWLDLALSSPTIGILCDPRLQFPHEMLEALKPALEKWKAANPNLLFHIPSQNGLVTIKIGNGVVCDLHGNAVNVSFKYESKVVDIPAGLPIIENAPVQAFSDIMVTVADVASTICEHMTAPPIALQRIGVVADCRLDAKALPPGVRKLIDHAGRPWGCEPLTFTGNVTTRLSKTDEWDYRCHHNVDFNPLERENDDVRVRLDWQKFTIGDARHVLTKNTARRFIDDAVKEANTYFATFGGGALDYGRT